MKRPRAITLLAVLGATIAFAIRLARRPKPIVDQHCNVNPHTGTPDNRHRDIFEEYSCFNNAQACTESARAALEKVDRTRWGPFDFFCHEGKVANVYAGLNSPIAKDHMGFIRDNPQLFGIRDAKDIELQAGSSGDQIYHGIRVASGVALLEKHGVGRYGDENYVELNAFLADTKGWNFEPARHISKEQAIEAARQYWGQARPEDVSGWRISDSEFWIRHDPPSKSDCPREPSAAWFIRAFGEGYPRKGLTKSYIREAIIDGKTGKACSLSGNGKSLLGGG